MLVYNKHTLNKIFYYMTLLNPGAVSEFV